VKTLKEHNANNIVKKLEKTILKKAGVLCDKCGEEMVVTCATCVKCPVCNFIGHKF